MSENHNPLSSLGGRHSSQHEEGEGNWLVSYADMMTLLVGFFVILLSFSTVDQEKLEGIKLSVSKEFGGQYVVPYDDLGNKIEESVKTQGLGNQVSIKVLPDGIEISFLGTVFFSSGSADLKDEGGKVLTSIFPIIKNEKTNFDITIEGHTDDNPVTSNPHYRDNFELSSLRACRVLDVFLKEGFKKDKMTAVGFGDSRPLVKNRDENGKPIPINQSQNRRVVIKLKKQLEPALENKKDENHNQSLKVKAPEHDA